MASSFTANKGIEQPAAGDYVNAWAPPVNANWLDIDTALGGTTPISVTGVPAGTITLTLTQYRPNNIEFSGTLSGNINYQLPAGVGGTWSIKNSTTGAFTLSFSISAGNSIALPAHRTLIVSDGVTIDTADSATLVTAEAYAAAQASAAQAAAISAAAASAASLYVAKTTNIGSLTGVTIQADPGTTPSGSPGQVFWYY